jgi:hypothetical protein
MRVSLLVMDFLVPQALADYVQSLAIYRRLSMSVDQAWGTEKSAKLVGHLRWTVP